METIRHEHTWVTNQKNEKRDGTPEVIKQGKWLMIFLDHPYILCHIPNLAWYSFNLQLWFGCFEVGYNLACKWLTVTRLVFQCVPAVKRDAVVPVHIVVVRTWKCRMSSSRPVVYVDVHVGWVMLCFDSLVLRLVVGRNKWPNMYCLWMRIINHCWTCFSKGGRETRNMHPYDWQCNICFSEVY